MKSLVLFLLFCISSSLFINSFTFGYSLSNPQTKTPIKHLVVIFQENVSFDHYFGTYPYAANLENGTKFTADNNTPTVNGLSFALSHNNTNKYKNEIVNPFRIDPSQLRTCDPSHAYAVEQNETNGGLMDNFVFPSHPSSDGERNLLCNPKQVMGYFDGNAVTALWNYAQHYAMSDNYFGTNFGSSTPGHINLISGQTHGTATLNAKIPPAFKFDAIVNGTLIGNLDPKYDDCSRNTGNYKNTSISMEGKNIGDLLNAKNMTWGWFSQGFIPSTKNADGTWTCNSVYHKSKGGTNNSDYYPDVEPFQYYNSTANPHHFPPSSNDKIGYTDIANHQYNLSSFWTAGQSGNLPEVSFIKAGSFQQGHPVSSGPLDEQSFLVNTINRIQNLPQWNDTAIIITYDDSGGWYDHVMPPIVSQSSDKANDMLVGKSDLMCGHVQKGSYNDRCGYGPRLPILIISPYSKTNYVDHSITDQTSILRFIEDNWNLGRIGNQSFDAKAGPLDNMFNYDIKAQNTTETKKLILNPDTGGIN
ncbi:MAG: phospholipase C [Candidatus Nitrosocosmicus sp.]